MIPLSAHLVNQTGPLRFPHLPGALCAQSDPDLWHPAENALAAHQIAKDICRQCPELSPCAAYAIADPSLRGIWGGMGTKERQKARRLLRPALRAS